MSLPRCNKCNTQLKVHTSLYLPAYCECRYYTLKEVDFLKEKYKSTFKSAHYQRGTIEPWDVIEDWNLDYWTGSVLKYICRAGFKPTESELDDLKKARTFLERRISFLEKKND